MPDIRNIFFWRCLGEGSTCSNAYMSYFCGSQLRAHKMALKSSFKLPQSRNSYVLAMRWKWNNTHSWFYSRYFVISCLSAKVWVSERRGGTRENFRLHFTICDCNNLHGSMHNLNFSCATRRRGVEGFVNVRSPTRGIPPDDRSTVPSER